MRKLHSERGASFIVALLVLFLCLMVGAVVIAAASAGIQHLNERRAEQQEYLTLSSAAELLTEGMRGVTFTAGETVTTYSCNESADPVVSSPVHETQHRTTTAVSAAPAAAAVHGYPSETALAAILGELAAEVYADGAAGERTFRLTFDGATAPETLADTAIDLVLSMRADEAARYSVTMELQLDGSAARTRYTLAFQAVSAVTAVEKTEKYTESVMKSVDDGLGNVTQQAVPTEFTKTMRTTTTAVTWSAAPALTKEGAGE